MAPTRVHDSDLNSGCRSGRDGDRGAATVEGAIALCSLVFVFGMVLAGVSAVIDQLRCTDAAFEAARMLARGQSQAAGRVVEAVAPESATFEVRYSASTVTVTVLAEPVGGLLPGVTISSEAHAELEPGVSAVADDGR